jgi:signal peptidase I
LVQQELYPSDEGREGHGDPGEPRTDEAAAGVSEAVTAEGDLEAGVVEAGERETGVIEASVIEASVIEASTVPPAVSLAALETVPPIPLGDGETAIASGSFVDIGDPGAGRIALAGGAVALLNVWKDEFIAWFKTLASAAVYATLIVTFGFQVARVEGQSMAPTLEDQDRLIVNKLAYRMGEPRRGDIVMLYYPVNPDKSFVKRVIAEEGDEVRIVNGRVHVKTPSGYEMQLPDDFVPPEFRSHEDLPSELVKDGYYYVMGDHRNNSSDSRHWGQVPKKYIIGKVQLRWWPIPNARVF